MPDVKKGAEAPSSKIETSKKPSAESSKKVEELNATRDAYIAVRGQKMQESKTNSIEKEDDKKNKKQSFAGAAVEFVEDAGKAAAETVSDILTFVLNTVMHGHEYATEYLKATDYARGMDVEQLTSLIDEIDNQIKDAMKKDNEDQEEEGNIFGNAKSEQIVGRVDGDTKKAIRDAAKSIKDNNNEGTNPNAEVNTADVVESEGKKAKRESSQHQ